MGPGLRILQFLKLFLGLRCLWGRESASGERHLSTAFKSVFGMIVGVDKLLSEIVEVLRLDIKVMKILAAMENI